MSDSKQLTFPSQNLQPEEYLSEMAIITEAWIQESVEIWKKKPPDPNFELILDAENSEDN